MLGLASEREQFTPLMVAQGGLCGNITRALAEEGKYPGITDLMSQLAVTGFAPLDRLMDPRAERLTFLGIAGGVAYENEVIGLKKTRGFGRRRRSGGRGGGASGGCRFPSPARTRPGWSQRQR